MAHQRKRRCVVALVRVLCMWCMCVLKDFDGLMNKYVCIQYFDGVYHAVCCNSGSY